MRQRLAPRCGFILVLSVASGLACNQLLGIEGAAVGCVSDVHCGPAESCFASVCQSLRPDAGAPDASDAGGSGHR